jgi:hypothetical protein
MAWKGNRMLTRWRIGAGILLFIQPAWGFIKWVLDWAGRVDIITSHLHDFGVQPVLDFLQNPPPWSFLPSVIAGLLLIWWDAKRKNIAALDPNQRLLIGFYLSCATLCGGIWLAAWFVNGSVKAAPTLPPLPKPVETQKAAPTPTPKPPWLSQEEAAQQQAKGHAILMYSPQEIFAMLAEGQNINVFVDRWVKVAGVTSSLPTPEKVQSKDYYRVEIKLDGARLSFGKVAAYFDPKKYGDALLNIRLGGQLKAACQLTKVDSKQPYPANSFYASITEYTFVYYNCEIL